MPSPRIQALSAEFDKCRSALATIEQTAVDAGRDLDDNEQADADKLRTRLGELSTELEPLVERERSIQATADVLARLNTGQAPRVSVRSEPEPNLTPGQWFSGYLSHLHGRTNEFARTVADQTTGDNAGLLPTPIVGDVIKFADPLRPVFNSFTPKPMPERGKTFERPRITQRVLVEEQETEKTQLASRKMTVTTETVTKRTFGGTLDVSRQDIDWTEPSVMDLLIQDFAEVYAEVTEEAACAALQTLAAGNTESFDDASAQALVSSLALGAVAVYGQCKRFPDTIWLGLDVWADWVSMVDGEDRLIFPNLGAGSIRLNDPSFQGNPLGFNVVVGPNLNEYAIILGVSRGIESYERRRGLLSAPNIAALGVDISYDGYVAFYGREEFFVDLVGES